VIPLRDAHRLRAAAKAAGVAVALAGLFLSLALARSADPAVSVLIVALGWAVGAAYGGYLGWVIGDALSVGRGVRAPTWTFRVASMMVLALLVAYWLGADRWLTPLLAAYVPAGMGSALAVAAWRSGRGASG
jgi:hypothetical protein